MANNNEDNTIRRIKTILAQYDENSAQTLAKIKQALEEKQYSDLSMIKDGDHFFYNGIEFVRLGEEQGGILCITSSRWGEAVFNEDECNDWRKSFVQKLLNSEFLDLLNKDDLLPYHSDLTADNGDTTYGECADYVGLLSCDLYRKYREFIPLYDERIWTCTPTHCGILSSDNPSGVRLVGPDGTFYSGCAFISYGIAPVCIFKKELFKE